MNYLHKSQNSVSKFGSNRGYALYSVAMKAHVFLIFMPFLMLSCGPKNKRPQQAAPASEKGETTPQQNATLREKLKKNFSLAELRCEAFLSETEKVSTDTLPLDHMSFNLVDGEMKKSDKQSLTLTASFSGSMKRVQFDLSSFEIVENETSEQVAGGLEAQKTSSEKFSAPKFDVVLTAALTSTERNENKPETKSSEHLEWSISSRGASKWKSMGRAFDFEISDGDASSKKLFSYLFRCGLVLKKHPNLP